MVKKSLLFFFAAVVSFDAANAAADEFPRDLVEEAMLVSPRIKRIQEDGFARRKAEEAELEVLFNSIRVQYETGEIDAEALKQSVQEGLQRDLAYFTELKAQLAPFKVGEGKTIFQLKSNKMVEGCKLALDLVASEFDNILEGRLPHGYSFQAPDMNFVGDGDHLYSSGRGIALKHLLSKTVLVLARESSVESVLGAAGIDPAVSPWVQYTPLPDGLAWEDVEINPYFATREDGRYIGILHNGYTFGGHRGETPKAWGPEDCSSFVAKYADTVPAATYHQSIRYQLNFGCHFLDIPGCEDICAKWEENVDEFRQDAYVKSLVKRTTPITSDLIQPGCIHAFRTFPDLQKKPLGSSGHTTFVLGAEGQGVDAKVWTIGVSRNLPAVDGIYVIDSFPLITDPLEGPRFRKTMYFDINER